MPLHRPDSYPDIMPETMLSAAGCYDYGRQVDCPYFGDVRAAVLDGAVPRVAALVARGASLTVTPSGGSTLAHLAAVEGDQEVLAYLVSQVGPSCLTQPDSEGAAPIHWLCTLGGTMRHVATSTLATQRERPRSWAHGAPPIRAHLAAPAAAGPASSSAGQAPGKGSADDDKEGSSGAAAGAAGASAGGVEVDLRGCSAAVVAKVEALAWVLNHAPLLDDVLYRGEIQDGGFRCPAHLAAEFEALAATPPAAAALQTPPEPAPEPKGKKAKAKAAAALAALSAAEASAQADAATAQALMELQTPEERAFAAEAAAAAARRASARQRLANLRDSQQETPLIWACSFEVDGGAAQDGARAAERLPLAQLLTLVHGADPNAQAANGTTALHAAARAGAQVLCEFLIYDAGASPAVRDAHGHTALSFARAHSRDKATIDLLRRCTPLDK